MGYSKVMSGGNARVMGRVRVRVRVIVQHALFRPRKHRPTLSTLGYGVSRDTAQCAQAERDEIHPEYTYVQAAVDAEPADQPTRALRRHAAQPLGSGLGLG